MNHTFGFRTMIALGLAMAVTGCASTEPPRPATKPAATPAPVASSLEARQLTEIEKKFLTDIEQGYDADIAEGKATEAMKADAMDQARFMARNWRDFVKEYPGKWVVILDGRIFADDTYAGALASAKSACPGRQYVVSHVDG